MTRQFRDRREPFRFPPSSRSARGAARDGARLCARRTRCRGRYLRLGRPGAAEFNRLEKLRDPSHARNLTRSELKGFFRTVGLPEPQLSSYELRSEIASLLARSFPNPGDDVKIVEIFKASAVDDRLGIPVWIEGEKIHYAYPVTILGAQRLAR